MFISYISRITLAILGVTILIWGGAKIADVENSTLKKSLIAAIACVIVSTLSQIFSFIPSIGWIIGKLVSVVAGAFIIKHVFDTDWMRTIIIMILPVLTLLLWVLFLIA